MPRAQLAAAALLCLLTAGCGGEEETACTLIGAVSATRVDVAADLRPEARTLEVTLCSAAGCDDPTMARGVAATQRVILPFADPESLDGPLTLRATLRDASGATIATDEVPVGLEERFPNGPDCGGQKVLESTVITLT